MRRGILTFAVASLLAATAIAEEKDVFDDDLLGVVGYSDAVSSGAGAPIARSASIVSDHGGKITLHIPRPYQLVSAGTVKERTTKRTANKPGGVNPLSAGLGVINVVNPMAWLMQPAMAGQTPAEMLEHEFHEQITDTKFRYIDGRVSAIEDLYLSVQAGLVELELPLSVDEDGIVEIDLAAVREQIGYIGGPPKSKIAFAVLAGLTSEIALFDFSVDADDRAQ